MLTSVTSQIVVMLTSSAIHILVMLTSLESSIRVDVARKPNCGHVDVSREPTITRISASEADLKVKKTSAEFFISFAFLRGSISTGCPVEKFTSFRGNKLLNGTIDFQY